MKQVMRRGSWLGLLFLGWLGTAVGGELRFSVNFDPAQLSHSSLNGYDLIGLEGCGWTHEIGAPLLPVKGVQVSVPAGAVVTGVEVVGSEYRVLPGFYNLYPAQPPRPISGMEAPEFVSPDPEIYSKSGPYPGELVKFAHQGSLGGYELAGFLVYPVQWLPRDGRLWLYTRIEVRVSYEMRGRKGPIPRSRSQKIEEMYQKWVEGMVKNPWDVARNRPGIGRSGFAPDVYEHVSITAEEYREKFQPLSDWLTKKGIPDTIVSTEDIYASYPGDDPQEQIRNFIIDAYENWSTVWVLLGGDTDVVPHRKTWALYSAGNWHDTIPCDLYYSDLDGDWDGDGDGVYGEPGDGVDMYPDVFVGRASVNTPSEVETFVDKVLGYEREPELGYQEKLLLPAEILFPGYPGDIVNDSIANLAPPDYQKSKLYETQGNLNSQAVLDSIEAGYQFSHYAAHGNINVISTGPDAIYNWDVDNLTNGGLLQISVGICCLIGAMDFDCIVEHFMNNPNGGTVAWIANSRYGWGTPPSLGPSERLDISFFDQVFNQDVTRVGKTLGAAKSEHIPEASVWPYMRWCVYALNLFGEPQLQMYTATPTEMVVSHLDTIPTGSQEFEVTVEYNSAPVVGALVCVSKPDEVYAYGLTGEDGSITFSIDPTSPGTMWVTATAQNHLPYEGSCEVEGEPVEPDIVVVPDTLFFDFTPGGETAALSGDETQPMWVINAGNGTLTVDSITTWEPWIVGIEPMSFEVLPGEWVSVLVTVDTSGLEDNITYYGQLSIFSNDPDENPYPEPVRLLKGGWYPDIVVVPDTLNFDFSGGFELASSLGADSSSFTSDVQPMWVLNIGGGVLEVTGITTETSWVVGIVPDSFLVGPGEQQEVLVTVDTSGLADSTYYGQLSIFSNDPDEPEYPEPVKLIKGGVEPDIELSPDTLIFAWTDSLTIPVDTLWVKNIGSSLLSVEDISSGASWVDGIIPSRFWVVALDSVPVEVRVDTTGLVNSTYLDSLTISSNDPDENPCYLPVKLVVNVTGIQEFPSPPQIYSLSIISPNPGVGRTMVGFGIPRVARVELKVYDSSGKLVRTLMAGQSLEPGAYRLVWDGRDGLGRRVSEGVYFVRMEAAEYTATRKLILLR